MDAEFSMEKMQAAFQRIREREERELHKLMEDPSLFDVATALTDALIKDLIYLCHFEKVVAHNGKEWTIIEVIKRLEANIRSTFKCITGREYVPEVVRTIHKVK